MGISATKQEYFYLMNAGKDLWFGDKIKHSCPRCGKALVYVGGQNGSYSIHCENDDCVSATFRGL